MVSGTSILFSVFRITISSVAYSSSFFFVSSRTLSLLEAEGAGESTRADSTFMLCVQAAPVDLHQFLTIVIVSP